MESFSSPNVYLLILSFYVQRRIFSGLQGDKIFLHVLVVVLII